MIKIESISLYQACDEGHIFWKTRVEGFMEGPYEGFSYGYSKEISYAWEFKGKAPEPPTEDQRKNFLKPLSRWKKLNLDTLST